jgi:molybdopterin-containing oxidoreductase family iron-sulfur binding subunit
LTIKNCFVIFLLLTFLEPEMDENELASHESGISRKDALRAAGLISGVAILGGAASVISRLTPGGNDPKGKGTIRSLPDLPEAAGNVNADIILRMQLDLKRAMEKPMEERRWGMVIDTQKCVGCHGCTVACVVENKLPPGVVYRPVVTEEKGKFPSIQIRFIPRPCMQCEVPPCVPVCPVEATWKRADGITVIDYDQCIGCRYCVSACPYNARTVDFGHYYTDDTPERQPYELLPNFEYGKEWDRRNGSPVGNARKCHFCLHRLEEGLLPQCVVTCIGRATYFGDLSDEDSLVSEMARKSNQITLLEELDTKPSVTYLL